jgi:DNA replication and repair protein RecF
MWIERLALSNFRNITKQEISFGRRINLLVGDNAQGKTNIIEGIYLLAVSKSFRASKDAELIRWGSEEALIKGRAGSNEVKLSLSQDGKKIVVNNRLRSRSYLIGVLPVVLFSPESLSIVSGPPEKRRRFLDQTLSVTNKNYLHVFGRYLKAMKNRNRLLWQIKQGGKIDLTVWNRQLVSLGSFLWAYRLEFIEAANQMLKNIGSKLIGSPIQIEYTPFHPKLKSEKEIRKFYEAELLKKERGDLDRGVTSFGPHRDDFRVFFNIFKGGKILEKDINVFGSRGEQRIATLSLKLLEVEFIEKNLGDRPTLLLDDVLSEFDRKNRDHITGLLPKQQSVITTTSANLFPQALLSKTKVFEVKEGVVTNPAGN